MTYKSIQANKVLQYVKKKYGTEPEFLWRKFPGNAILRHKSSSKWYAALLTISERKLGLDGDTDIDILDLKCEPKLIHFVIDRKKIFPGYHMNKNNWVTIILDGRIKDKALFALIDASYDLSAAK
jgi:predicted DNA-binding protein (MmcQ/YjbR family)